ncbi:hypothetical protein KFU94_40395 [Chloroflexi bacterium TSY]|nr:hypothetical protein [Chloroflexi bacterium TSY]
MHIYVYTLPLTPVAIPEPDHAETVWWGFWPIQYASWWLVAIGTMVICGVIFVFWLDEAKQSNVWSRWGKELWVLSSFGSLYVVAIALIISFFAFPLIHTRWGDAYILTNAIAWPDPTVRLTHSWQAPLDVFLHSQVWLHFHEALSWSDAMPVYHILSPVAGILYLLVSLALSRQLHFSPPWLTVGFLTSLGLLQLFFGYVENYSFAAVGVLAYLWIGLAVLSGEKPLWLAATVLALTNAFHPSTIILSPSLLFLGWQWTRRQKMSKGSFRKAIVQIALPTMAIATFTILLMEWGDHGIASLLTDDRPGGSDARPFVPLFETTTRWEHFTMFSWLHLREFLNEQVLIAPVVLPSLLWFALINLVQRTQTATTRNLPHHPPSTIHFLLMTTTSYFLFTWVWNPDYGGQRDWDLFSLAALPATILLIVLLSCQLSNKRYLAAAAVPLLLVQGFHTTLWVYQNTLPWSWP